MGPAATSAMAVGEIRNVVLKYINSPHALARAARVSIAWHKDAIKYLWRGVTSEEIWQDAMFRVWRTPDIMTLCKLAQNIARFRHYAGHIKYLTLWWKGRKVGNPQDAWIVEVPDLWSASPYISVCLMNIYTNMAPARSIQCLLKPALRALELGDCLLTEGLASAIKTRAPMLRWLGVDIRASRKHEQRSPQLFPAFLQDMRHLKGIEISNAVDAGIGAAIMEHPNLAILHVHGRMPLASKSLPISTIALANLQELKLEFVGLPRETVRAMLLASSNLTIFEISLDLP